MRSHLHRRTFRAAEGFDPKANPAYLAARAEHDRLLDRYEPAEALRRFLSYLETV